MIGKKDFSSYLLPPEKRTQEVRPDQKDIGRQMWELDQNMRLLMASLESMQRQLDDMSLYLPFIAKNVSGKDK